MKKLSFFFPHLWCALALIVFCCSEEPAAEQYVPSANFWEYNGDIRILSKVITDLKKDPNVTDLQKDLGGQPLWADSKSYLLDGVPTILIPVVNPKGDRIKAVVMVQYKGKEKRLSAELVFRRNLQKKEGEYYHMTRAAWRGFFKALDRTILNKKNNSAGFTVNELPEERKQKISSSRAMGQECGLVEYEDCWITEACTNGECEETYIICETRQEWECWWVDDDCFDECNPSCVNYTGDPCVCNNDCGGDDGGGDEPCYDQCNPDCVNYTGCETGPDDVLVNVEDPCLLNATTTFKNQSAYLSTTFGGNPNLDMEYVDEALGSGLDHEFANTHKQTNGGGYTKIITTLNTSTLDNASKEFVSATLIHEMYHAYVILNDPAHSDNEESHIYMSRPDVIDAMAQMLRNLYPSMDVQTSIDLSWGGLESTPNYNALSAADKARINITNMDHKHGAHGTPCP